MKALIGADTTTTQYLVQHTDKQISKEKELILKEIKKSLHWFDEISLRGSLYDSIFGAIRFLDKDLLGTGNHSILEIK